MKLEDYPFKTKPDAHQLKYLQEHAQNKAFALFWEMGVAKTKPTIDNICLLYAQGEINGALVVAPNGLDLNWLVEEIPKHLPDEFAAVSRIHRFNTKTAKAKYAKDQRKFLLSHHGLAWLLMSYDAFMTEDGKEIALKFAEQRETFYVLDESSAIKTPAAKRTQRIVRTSWRAKYKRILEGTPITLGAEDIYKQIEFLDNTFWARHGWDNIALFRNYFCVYETTPTWVKTKEGPKNIELNKLVGYKNLEELNKLIQPISSRLLKKDVLDLPPKIYSPIYFELTPEQRKLYDALENEYRVELENGGYVASTLAIVRMLRLHQISCGYLPMESDDPDGEPLYVIPGKNPRLNLLEQLVDSIEAPTIIWCKYRLDMSLIKDMFKKKANSKPLAVYDAQSTDAEKLEAKRRFMDGDCNWLLATMQSMQRGHTLHRAENCIYYSNGMNMGMRKQSEDRAHRRGLEHPVNYIDLLGVQTQDKNIMLNLCRKMDTADAIMGDTPDTDIREQLKEWLK